MCSERGSRPQKGAGARGGLFQGQLVLLCVCCCIKVFVSVCCDSRTYDLFEWRRGVCGGVSN